MSIEIYNTETLESYHYLSGTIEESIPKLPDPHSALFLISAEGDLIDLRSKPPPGVSCMYLFKKSSITTACVLQEPNPKDYEPEVKYPDPIDFDSYHNIREPFQSIPQIEKDLFENQKQAIKYYTSCKMLKDLVTKTILIGKIRVDASAAMRLYMEKFVKSRYEEFKELFEEVEKLHKIVFTNSLVFRDKLSRVRDKTLPDDVKEFIQSSLRGYANVLSEKSSQLKAKVSEIGKIFDNATESLSNSELSYFNVRTTVDKDTEKLKQNIAYNDDLSELVTMINDYTKFRQRFIKAEAEEQSSEIREKLAIEMQSMQSNITRGSNILLTYKQKLELATNQYKLANQTQRRVQDFYKIKTISEFVKISHRIKYLFSDKLIKIKRKIKKLDQLKEFLTIPDRIEEACKAAEDEESRSTLKMMEIQDLYVNLCQAIIKDHSERKIFLEKYGAILPKASCEGLNESVISRGYLRQLVKINNCCEVPEPCVNEMSKVELIKYYEGLLASKEQNYTREINELKKKEQKLQDHYVYLTRYKEKIQKDTRNQENTLKKYMEELEAYRRHNFSEFYAKRFQNEVEKLKEKEKVFKAIHLMNLRSLENENDQLKSSRWYK